MDDIVSALKKHKAFTVALGINIIVLVYNFFVEDPKIFFKTFGILLTILLVILYELINLIDKKLSDSFYLDKINSKLPDDFSALVKKSRAIKLLGIHLDNLLKNHKDDLEFALSKGAEISLIVVPSDSHAIYMTALRYLSEDTNISVQNENSRLQSTLSTVKSWSKKYNKKIKIKETDYLFEHELIILDDIIIDTRYNFGTKSSGNKPKFFYKKETEWYKFCLKEFENHWNKGRDINVNS